MSAAHSAAKPEHNYLSPEAQATALWTYVQGRTSSFTLEAAIDLIEQLRPRRGEAPKALAKRLRKALQAQGIAFKHTHALHAASRLCGYDSWHTNEEAGVPRLRFSTLDTDAVHEMEFSSWAELADELCAWTNRLLARGQLPLSVLTLNFTGDVINLSTPVPPADGSKQQRSQAWPLGTISSIVNDPHWLDDAVGAFEKLRRLIEEGGKAVLDGYAVLRFSATSRDESWHPMAVTVSDVTNSELVLMREDNEDDPRSGYEIARGDELTCWHQLELSLRDDRTDAMPDVQVTIPDEGVGAWFVNGIRYVWALETLKPQAYIPGRVNRGLGISDCNHLLRRYKLAKRIHGKTFKHKDQSKHVDYLSGPPENYRVDLHFMLHRLKEAGLTWDSYIEKFGMEPLTMQDVLPVGFVFQLLQNLHIENPNKIFARPNFSEMARVDDDALMRALMPRVETVRFVMPLDVDEDTATTLRSAVDDFNAGLRLQKLVAAGGLEMETELPHLVYASEAEQLCGTVDELGFVMYVAVVPHLHSIKGLVPDMPELPNMWPWALGNALFLRFERQGGAQ